MSESRKFAWQGNGNPACLPENVANIAAFARTVRHLRDDVRTGGAEIAHLLGVMQESAGPEGKSPEAVEGQSARLASKVAEHLDAAYLALAELTRTAKAVQVAVQEQDERRGAAARAVGIKF